MVSSLEEEVFARSRSRTCLKCGKNSVASATWRKLGAKFVANVRKTLKKKQLAVNKNIKMVKKYISHENKKNLSSAVLYRMYKNTIRFAISMSVFQET
jgi:hypothetical protein